MARWPPTKKHEAAGRRRRRRIVLAAVVAIIFLVLIGSAYFWVTECVPSYRTALQSRLSSELSLHVHIGSLNLSWNGLQPRFLIRNVEIKTVGGKEVLQLKSALAGVSLRSLLLGTIRPQNVELVGLHLYLSTEAGRHWLIAGFSSGASNLPTNWLPALWELKSFAIRRGAVSIDDSRHSAELPWNFHAEFNAVKTNHGMSIRGIVTPPKKIAGLIRIHLQINGNPKKPSSLSGQWAANIVDLHSLSLARGRYQGLELGFDQGMIRSAGTFRSGRVVRSTLYIRARAIEVQHVVQAIVIARNIDAEAHFKRSEHGWHLEKFQIEDTGEHKRWSAHANGFCRHLADSAGRCEVDIPHLTLTDVIPWLKLWPGATSLLAGLPSLHGELDHLQIAADLQKDGLTGWHVNAVLHDVGWRAHGLIPGVDGLSGAASIGRSNGEFVIEGPAPTFVMPSHFEVPVKFSRLSGILSWTHHERKWSFESSNLSWKILGLQGSGQAQLIFPDSDAGLNTVGLGLDFRFSDENISQLKPLLPTQWGKSLRNWLKKSVIQARLVSGNARYYGLLQDFPFGKTTSGRFVMNLRLAEATLRYAVNWPLAKHLTANLRFQGNGLEIRSGHGAVGLMKFDHLRGGVSDFRNAPAVVTLSSQGDAKNLYALLRQSPLRSRLGKLLNRTTASGPVSVNLKATDPLRRGKALSVSGSVQLLGATMGINGLRFPLTHVRGRIGFNDSSVHATGLKALARTTVIQGSITPAPNSPSGILLLNANLQVGQSAGISALLLPHWISARMRGASIWHMRLPFSGKHAGRLVLQSSLKGTAITLPPPFGKTASDSFPVTATFDAAMPGKSERFALRTKSFSMAAWLTSSGSSAQGKKIRVDRLGLRIGAGPPPVPSSNEIRVSGKMPELDLVRAAPFLRSIAVASGASTNGLFSGISSGPTVDVDLRVDQLSFGNFRLKPVQLRMQLNAANLQLKVAGPGAEGIFSWAHRKNILYGRLTHVSLLSPVEGTTHPGIRRPYPVHSNLITQKPSSPIDPAKMPALNWTFEKVRIGNFQLGRFRILTRRLTQGQKIRVLTVSGSKNVGLDATGEWLRSAMGSTAKANFAFHVNHLARVLKAFGYLPNVTARSAKIRGNLVWPSAESGVNLAHAEGRVRLDITNGILKAVHPGAERVLGLLNIYALPRRLMLNFNDINDNGLAFDRIGGSFQLGHGEAKTDDLRVDGPALRMTIHGRIGLADRNFHETVTVYPNISTGITLGATLLGGPIAGGIALLSQKLFGQQMDSFASFSYRVTGSWDNPVITRVGAVAKAKKSVKQKSVKQKHEGKVAPSKTPSVSPQ